jgi:hypothetical protein
MFVHLAGHGSLGIIPDQVVAVIESINSPNIGTPMGTERTKAYIVGLRLPSGNFTCAIYLHLLESSRACIYAANPLEVCLEDYSEQEAEAIQFAESMGLMLDNVNFRSRPPDEIARLTQELPFFHEHPPKTSSFSLADVPDGGGRLIPGEQPPAPANTLPPEDVAALARLLSSF